jgi:hypothetical protein
MHDEEKVTDIANNTSGFDITAQIELAKKEDEGTTFQLEGVDGSPMFYTKDGEQVPVTITVAGSNSNKFKEIEAKLRKQKLRARSLTGDTLHRQQIEKAAYCTVSWDGILDKGTPVRCDHANAVALYTQLPFVLRQVLEAMDDHESFFTKGS